MKLIWSKVNGQGGPRYQYTCSYNVLHSPSSVGWNYLCPINFWPYKFHEFTHSWKYHHILDITSGQDVCLMQLSLLFNSFLVERSTELNWSTDLLSWRQFWCYEAKWEECESQLSPWIKLRALGLRLGNCHNLCVYCTGTLVLVTAYFCLLTSIISTEASRSTSWQGWDLGTRLHLHLRRVSSLRQATDMLATWAQGAAVH